MAILNDDGILSISGAVQHVNATQEEWEVLEYVPAEGEVCSATDTGVTKVGDGIHTWNDLPNPYEKTANNYLDSIIGIDCGQITE